MPAAAHFFLTGHDLRRPLRLGWAVLLLAGGCAGQASPTVSSPSTPITPAEPTAAVNEPDDDVSDDVAADDPIADLQEKIRQLTEQLQPSAREPDVTPPPVGEPELARAEQPEAAVSAESVVAPLDVTQGRHSAGEIDPGTPRMTALGEAPAPDAWDDAQAQPAQTAQPAASFEDVFRDRLTSRDGTAARAFDARLFEMLTGQPLPGGASPANLSPADQRILDALLPRLNEFRSGYQSGELRDPAQVARPLIELAAEMRQQTGLALPTVALCNNVRGFGDYDPMSPVFPVGNTRPTVLYVEVDNFKSERLSTNGDYETSLLLTAVLYDPEGNPVLSLGPDPIKDHARRPRRDFFLAGRLNLPATVTPGSYILKVTVKDELAQRVAQGSIKLQFTENR